MFSKDMMIRVEQQEEMLAYIRDNEQMMNPESSIPEFLILWLKIINNIGWVSASKSDASNLCCKMDFLSTKARSIFVCHQLKYFFFFLCH